MCLIVEIEAMASFLFFKRRTLKRPSKYTQVYVYCILRLHDQKVRNLASHTLICVQYERELDHLEMLKIHAYFNLPQLLST